MKDDTKLKETIATLADMTRKSMEIDLQIVKILLVQYILLEIQETSLLL